MAHLGGLLKLEAVAGLWPLGVRRVATAALQVAALATGAPFISTPHRAGPMRAAGLIPPFPPNSRTPVWTGHRHCKKLVWGRVEGPANKHDRL